MLEYLEIGQIVNTSGLNGVVKVNPFTDDITRFEKLKTVLLDKNGTLVEYEIEQVRYHKNMVMLKLKGIDDINQAEMLRNLYIKINRKYAVKLPKDSYFIVDLLGLEVYTVEGELLGTVNDIFPTGSNDVYVVKDEFGKQILIPALKTVIKDIDLESKKIIVELPEGLI